MNIVNLTTYARRLFLAFVLMLTACSEPPSDVGKRSPVNIVAKNQRSANFTAISQHLDLGGTLYGYVDIEGDIAKLTEQVSAYLNKMRVLEPGKIPEHINFKTIIERLGLQQIYGIGVSSYQRDDLFRNKTFVYAPGQPEGLLKVFAGKNIPFESIARAPAGADLLIEQSLDVTAIRDLVLAIANDVMGEFGEGMINAQLEQPLGGMSSLTLTKVIDSLNTRLVVVADINTSRKLAVQSADIAIDLSAVDFYISLDNVGWLIDELATSFGAMPQLTFDDTPSAHSVFINMPLPEPWNYYSPVFKHDKTSKRLVIASSGDFLERCLSANSGIRKDDAFKAATRDLPKEGNNFQYMSPTIGKEGQRLMDSILAQHSEDGMQTVLSTYQDMLPSAKHGTAAATQRLAEGFLVVSNSETSHKSSMTLAAVNPATIGILAAMAIPAFNNIRGESISQATHQSIQRDSDLKQNRYVAADDNARKNTTTSVSTYESNARQKMVDMIVLTGTSQKGAIINGKFTKMGRTFKLGVESFKLVRVTRSKIIVQGPGGGFYEKSI